MTQGRTWTLVSAAKDGNQRAFEILVERHQQKMLAFAQRSVYWLLAATSALMFLLCFFLAKNEPGKRGQVAIH